MLLNLKGENGLRSPLWSGEPNVYFFNKKISEKSKEWIPENYPTIMSDELTKYQRSKKLWSKNHGALLDQGEGEYGT